MRRSTDIARHQTTARREDTEKIWLHPGPVPAAGAQKPLPIPTAPITTARLVMTKPTRRPFAPALALLLLGIALPLSAQTIYSSDTTLSKATSVSGFVITNSAVLTIAPGGSLDTGFFASSYVGGSTSATGSGTLVVLPGGSIAGYREYLGFLSGSVGTAMLSGSNATWSTDSVYVGSSGIGFLTLSGGSKVTGTNAYLGVNSSGTGTATLSGNGSTWTNSSDLYVGSSGTGTVTANSGATLSSSTAYVGYFGGATGTVTLTGNGSRWTSSTSASIGDSGTGNLTISAGATASTPIAYLGYESSGVGSVTVSGNRSTWTQDSFLVVGRVGTGALAIENGGNVTTPLTRVGGNTQAARGTITVSGPGSILNNTGDLTLGDSGTGNLTVSAGGTVLSANATLANFSSGRSAVTITGNGSTWTNSGRLRVGASGYASLEVTAGGVVSSLGGTIGSGAGGKTSTATIIGSGSRWNLGTSALDIDGALVVTDGGRVTAGNATVNSSATARISGLSAEWNTTRLTNSGTVTVANYATIIATNTLTGGTYNIGDFAGNSTFGFLNVPGVSGATLNFNQTDTAYFAVPVTGGRIVQRGPGITQLFSATTANITVSAGALNFNKRTAFQNAITANWTAGNLSVASGATAAFSVGGTGEFTSADLDLLKGLGNATSGFRSGSFLGFNTANAPGGAFTYTSAIANPNGGANVLGVAKFGTGSLTLTGGNTYSGGTILWEGTLIVNASTALGTGNVTVNGGTLQIASGVALPGKITLAGGTLSQQVPNGTNFATISQFDGTLSGGLPTVANLLAGTASAPAKIDAGFSAVSSATNDVLRQSGIFSLTGIPVLDLNTGATDIFVLQLAVPNVTIDSFLGWLSPTTQNWVNAVDGNIGGTKFFAGDGAYDPATDFSLGTYGVDTAKGTVWAVLNHNSEFSILAPVPEPGTLALLGLGALALLAHRRRRA